MVGISEWLYLPDHILDLIFDKIRTPKDSLIFGVICVKWYQIFKHNRSKLVKKARHLQPKLLVPNQSETHNSWSVRSIIAKQNNVVLRSELLLPSYNKAFAGSSEGWLATLDTKLGVTLYKPLMEEDEETSIIHLPPLFPSEDGDVEFEYTNREYYLMKFTTFTPNPVLNPNDFIMVVIYGPNSQLAYITTSVKDATWTHIPSSLNKCFDDVLYYNDTFYALLNGTGGLVSLDISNDPSQAQPSLKLIVPRTPKTEYRYFCDKRYLVDSYKGQLLQVERYRERCRARVTKAFKLFKLSFDRSKWIEINSLEDEALFIGDSTSVSVDTSSISTQCHSNCIYFVHDKDTTGFGVGPLDCGVYNLKTGSVLRLFNIDKRLFRLWGERIPIWVEPTIFNKGSTEAQKGTT